MKKSASFSVVMAFAFIWTVATRPVHAYLDPGTGSYLFQIGLASLFGVLFALKTYWFQVKHFVLAKVLRKEVAQPEAATQSKKGKS